ncbi:MAG: hypothetical protein HOG49_36565 [Candidatus Scalindua sp.]|jgi:hypothetical protein|nr:hypothetical protein [Candidatus Scalindua sp.]
MKYKVGDKVWVEYKVGSINYPPIKVVYVGPVKIINYIESNVVVNEIECPYAISFPIGVLFGNRLEYDGVVSEKEIKYKI